MKKFVMFINKLFKSRRFNLFLVISFIIFAILDFMAKYYLSFVIDIVVVITESLRFIENCKKK